MVCLDVSYMLPHGRITSVWELMTCCSKYLVEAGMWMGLMDGVYGWQMVLALRKFLGR